MHRFFVPPESIKDKRASLRGPVVHQIRDVLRMRSGEEIILLDNSGAAYQVKIEAVDPDLVRGRVTEKWKLDTEPRTKITLYQGMLKGQKFDWVLQKGTELGITSFVPVLAARCLVGSVDDVSDTRLERWQRIVSEAAEQSGRAVLPKLDSAIFFQHACQQVTGRGLSLIPYEGEKDRGLREALASAPRARAINIFVGPEGGFTEEEIATAQNFGVLPITLGPRIFRAETAGIGAASAILYELGDLE